MHGNAVLPPYCSRTTSVHVQSIRARKLTARDSYGPWKSSRRGIHVHVRPGLPPLTSGCCVATDLQGLISTYWHGPAIGPVPEPGWVLTNWVSSCSCGTGPSPATSAVPSLSGCRPGPGSVELNHTPPLLRRSAGPSLAGPVPSPSHTSATRERTAGGPDRRTSLAALPPTDR